MRNLHQVLSVTTGGSQESQQKGRIRQNICGLTHRQTNAKKNWLTIVSYEQNTVLHDTYLTNLSVLSDGNSCWLPNIRNLVDYKLGETYVWENQVSNKKGPDKQLMSNMSNVMNIFNLQWTKALNKRENETGVKNKLRT